MDDVPDHPGCPDIDAVHPAAPSNTAITTATTRALARIVVPAITLEAWRPSHPQARKSPE
jgi:hypothetical protein